jgi:hypothetical protein
LKRFSLSPQIGRASGIAFVQDLDGADTVGPEMAEILPQLAPGDDDADRRAACYVYRTTGDSGAEAGKAFRPDYDTTLWSVK